MKKYDTMFIFPDSLKDDSLEKALDRIREEITKLDGQVAKTTVLGRRGFARRMKKQSGGQYVSMMFELNPQSIDALVGRFKLNEDIFRTQILRADEKVKVEEKAESEERSAVKEADSHG